MAAVDIYLKLESPAVDGETVVKGHEKELALLSWSWGATQHGTTHEATGSGKGKASFQDAQFTMTVDKSAVTLLQFCSLGTHIGKGTLTQRKAGGDNPVDYIKFEIEDIIVSSFQISGSGPDAIVSVSLNFGKFKLAVSEQTAKGGKGAAPDFSYNIAQAAKS